MINIFGGIIKHNSSKYNRWIRFIISRIKLLKSTYSVINMPIVIVYTSEDGGVAHL